MNQKASTQYLQRYAEVENDSLHGWPKGHHYQHVVLIPAYKESISFLRTMLTARWFGSGVLVILIVNQPNSETNPAPQQSLHDAAKQSGETLWQSNNLTLIAPNHPATSNFTHHGHLLLVDRFNNPIPAKQGVGLARKIGADLALALINQGSIKTDWICSTDADATLPDNYFSALKTVPVDAVAACYDFEHTAPTEDRTSPENTAEITAATLIYERALRYYVAGLRYAGSPYAHFTIGSILAFKTSAYTQVRGFPKRSAGEDFYLLNKLVKLGAVTQIKATIQLQARLSDRVPFGTGVSTAKIMQLNRDGQPFCYYHPEIFTALRGVLDHFDQLWANRVIIDQWLNELPYSSAQALSGLGFEAIAEKLRQQCHNKQQFDRQIHGWFDGLKTLQFVHALRATDYPNLPLEQAIQQATFMA